MLFARLYGQWLRPLVIGIVAARGSKVDQALGLVERRHCGLPCRTLGLLDMEPVWRMQTLVVWELEVDWMALREVLLEEPILSCVDGHAWLRVLEAEARGW